MRNCSALVVHGLPSVETKSEDGMRRIVWLVKVRLRRWWPRARYALCLVGAWKLVIGKCSHRLVSSMHSDFCMYQGGIRVRNNNMYLGQERLGSDGLILVC